MPSDTRSNSHHSNQNESNKSKKSSVSSNESIKSEHAVNECDIAHAVDSNSNDVIFEETKITNTSTNFNIKKRKSIDIIEINDNDDIIDNSYTSHDKSQNKSAKKFKTSLNELIVESLSSDSIKEDPKEEKIGQINENEEDDDALVDLRLSFANFQPEPVVITSESSSDKKEVEVADVNEDELVILDDKDDDNRVVNLVDESKEKSEHPPILNLSQETDRDANDAALGKF